MFRTRAPACAAPSTSSRDAARFCASSRSLIGASSRVVVREHSEWLAGGSPRHRARRARCTIVASSSGSAKTQTHLTSELITTRHSRARASRTHAQGRQFIPTDIVDALPEKLDTSTDESDAACRLVTVEDIESTYLDDFVEDIVNEKDFEETRAHSRALKAAYAKYAEFTEGVPKRERGLALFAVLMCFYGANIPLVKVSQESMSTDLFAALRFTVGALVFSPFLKSAVKDMRIVRGGLELGLWCSLGYYLQNIGLEYTDAARASFISAFTIIVVPILAGLAGREVRSSTWGATGIALVGLAMMENLIPIPGVLDHEDVQEAKGDLIDSVNVIIDQVAPVELIDSVSDFIDQVAPTDLIDSMQEAKGDLIDSVNDLIDQVANVDLIDSVSGFIDDATNANAAEIATVVNFAAASTSDSVQSAATLTMDSAQNVAAVALDVASVPENLTVFGDLCTLGSALIFGIHIFRTDCIFNGVALKHKESMGLVCLQMLTVVTVFAGLLTMDYTNQAGNLEAVFGFSDWSQVPWDKVFFVGAISTAGCIYLETVALTLIPSEEATLMYSTESIWGAIFAYFILGETLSTSSQIGAVLILLSTVVGASSHAGGEVVEQVE